MKMLIATERYLKNEFEERINTLTNDTYSKLYVATNTFQQKEEKNIKIYEKFKFCSDESIQAVIEDIKGLINIISKEKIDIIIVESANCFFPCVLAAAKTKKQVICSYEGTKLLGLSYDSNAKSYSNLVKLADEIFKINKNVNDNFYESSIITTLIEKYSDRFIINSDILNSFTLFMKYLGEKNALESENKKYKQEIENLRKELMENNDNPSLMRFAQANYHYLRKEKLCKFIYKALKSIINLIIYGIKFIARKIAKLFRITIGSCINNITLKKILREHRGQKIFVFYPGYDWYMKMYQRPQHIASQISENGILYFYCTLNINDKVRGFKKIKDNLYVTNYFELLKKKLPKYTLQMYANMNGCWINELKEIQGKGNDILYEYIDDLHEDLTTIPPSLIERHEYALKDESIKVVATAGYLYEKALKYRNKNIILSTNGVIYEDFKIDKMPELPDKIKDIVSEGKNIIGYYGALAKWFDYELILEIAKKHPDYNILLIGIDYDESFKKYNYFEDISNIYYIGPVDYKQLVRYGAYCTVLTIPFKINEITKATSPVKVFEYMAMEKPIVTTDLPECRKYKSVMISKTYDEFIQNLEKAICIKDDIKYKKILREESLKNTWQRKAKEILDLMEVKND